MSAERVQPETGIPTGLDLAREVLTRLRDRPHNGHPDGTCLDCPFASAPLDSAGRVELWENISNDPTEAYFRCFLPSRDSSVVEWGEYAPCEESEWYTAALAGLNSVWKVGDRCRATRFGESKNGTIVALAYEGEVAMVQRDGEAVERHYLARNLHPAVDE